MHAIRRANALKDGVVCDELTGLQVKHEFEGGIRLRLYKELVVRPISPAPLASQVSLDLPMSRFFNVDLMCGYSVALSRLPGLCATLHFPIFNSAAL
jgi:hypothetical protein